MCHCIFLLYAIYKKYAIVFEKILKIFVTILWGDYPSPVGIGRVVWWLYI